MYLLYIINLINYNWFIDDTIKIYVMQSTYGVYKYCMITSAKIPLRIEYADENVIYELIHVLLTLRVCNIFFTFTLYKILIRNILRY